jgi:hypothetical protein
MYSRRLMECFMQMTMSKPDLKMQSPAISAASWRRLRFLTLSQVTFLTCLLPLLLHKMWLNPQVKTKLERLHAPLYNHLTLRCGNLRINSKTHFNSINCLIHNLTSRGEIYSQKKWLMQLFASIRSCHHYLLYSSTKHFFHHSSIASGVVMDSIFPSGHHQS